MNERKIIDHVGAGLLPCPFCGAKEAEKLPAGWDDVLLREDHRPAAWDGAWPEHVVFSVKCGCCGAEINRATMEAVIEAWNRRTKPGEPTYYDQRMKEQREALERLPGLLAGDYNAQDARRRARSRLFCD